MELDNLIYSNLIFTLAENIEGVPVRPRLELNLNPELNFCFLIK